MRVRLDADRCVGHGRCYVLAPEVFGEDERGYCVIVREQVPRESADAARRAVENCPEGALGLLDE